MNGPRRLGLRREARPGQVRRRLALATWRPSKDGRIYARMAIDATPVLEYVDRARAETGERVTVTHVVGAALARAIKDVPEIRARVVLGRIVEFKTCDVAFAVDIDGGNDLAPVAVKSADDKTPADIARELTPAVTELRSGTDAGHRLTTAIVQHSPWWTLRPVLSVAGLVVSGFGYSAFGQKGFPLGVAFVSNVGTLGLDEAFLAPLPFARVPVYLAVGAVRDAAVVVDGEVAVRPQIVLVATADHRLVDGAHAGRIVQVMRALLADPSLMDAPGRFVHDRT
ncbi:MAG: 2-oxo acid dehydrogenase subunit E2 [Propionibacteriales bacterium]|nr:2-oxo acid dehydrogenase subunit E2 [Propionibacteriales bacterium]